MRDSETLTCELLIIGTGMAGMAAGLFAANRGLSVVQVGSAGAIGFASGFLDLLGVHPISENRVRKNPWRGIISLVRDNPRHPYARVREADIRAAFDEVLSFLADRGVPYFRREESNLTALTPAGTVKNTYCVPVTMRGGIEALEEKPPCLLVDINGLKGFSARQIMAVHHEAWPGLRTAFVDFPGSDRFGDIYTERIAMSLEAPQNREPFARNLMPYIKDARVVGLPAALGIYRTAEIVSDIEKIIGVPVFELPTLPPSVPGMRIKAVFEQGIREKGVRLFMQKRVVAVKPSTDECFVSRIGNPHIDNRPGETIVRSRGIILASGRFLAGGLHAGRQGVRETILNLRVFHPENRKDWHRDDFLDPRGHPINRAGLEIDDEFRVVDAAGRPIFPGLFAAGSILAHHDWMRMHCGSGLAIVTALGAVRAFIRRFR
jgi:glycerol-3-phosphate dehydrogenase subunit B